MAHPPEGCGLRIERSTREHRRRRIVSKDSPTNPQFAPQRRKAPRRPTPSDASQRNHRAGEMNRHRTSERTIKIDQRNI